MQQVPGGRTACFHPRPLPPHPSSTLPGPTPVCEARGGHAEPRTPSTGGPGEEAAPRHHAAPLCPHQRSGALLILGFLPSGGDNQQLRCRAGERLGRQLRVSQAGLTPGHGGLAAPRLPSEHPQPAPQLGLSPCHPLRAGMPDSARDRAEATGLPCPCIAQEVLVVPREGAAQQRATTMPSPKPGPTPSPLSPPGMSLQSRPTACPHQEGGSRARTEVTRCAQPCRSGLRYGRGHRPLHPAAALGATTGTLTHPGTHGTAGSAAAPSRPRWPGQQPQHGKTGQDGEGNTQGRSKGLRWRQKHQNSPGFNPNKGRSQLRGCLSNRPQGCQVPTRGRGRRKRPQAHLGEKEGFWGQEGDRGASACPGEGLAPLCQRALAHHGAGHGQGRAVLQRLKRQHLQAAGLDPAPPPQPCPAASARPRRRRPTGTPRPPRPRRQPAPRGARGPAPPRPPGWDEERPRAGDGRAGAERRWDWRGHWVCCRGIGPCTGWHAGLVGTWALTWDRAAPGCAPGIGRRVDSHTGLASTWILRPD